MLGDMTTEKLEQSTILAEQTFPVEKQNLFPPLTSQKTRMLQKQELCCYDYYKLTSTSSP